MQELHKKGMMDKPATFNTVVSHYEGMADAPTLAVNGGGRVSPTMGDRVHDNLQRVMDKVLGQVFQIVVKDVDVNVCLRRTTRSKKVEYSVEEIIPEDMAA